MVHSAVYHLGDLRLAAGGVLTDARLAYRTMGRLNQAGDNAVLLPTYYAGSDRGYDPLIGRGRALDPERWFVVIVNLFGNGASTSPSNWTGSGRYPLVDIGDNVMAQHQLLTAGLGVRSLRLAAGWSMGGMQALRWGMTWPDFVGNIVAWCGTARCWPLNRVFLDGARAALLADPRPGHENGRRAFGRVYAGWAYSAAFYREKLWQSLGYSDLESFLRQWEDDHVGWDARDLLAMLETWKASDPGRAFGGDLADALRRITAPTVYMPNDHDMYFTRAEAMLEAGLVAGARLVPLGSPLGHGAGAPGRCRATTSMIDDMLRMVLGDP